MVLGHSRIGGYGAGIRRFGHSVVVELEMGLAEVVPCLAVVVLQGDGAAIRGNGLLVLGLAKVQQPERHLSPSVIRGRARDFL